MQLEHSSKKQAALRDELTGVLSRSALYSYLEAHAVQARHNHTVFSLLVFDLDYFKSINDAFGHSRGDQLLIHFVRRIETVIRGADLLFRFGGDEFALLLPDTDRAEAVVMGRRLVESVRSEPFEGVPPVSISLSGGLAAFPEDAETVEALFERADQRNYQAKRTGRGRIVTHDDPVDAAGQLSSSIESPSRLLERDRAMQDFNSFLAELATPGGSEPRGLVLLNGPAGAGHTRFLAEARQVAHLQGYGVLAVQGGAALKNRYLGALSETFQNLPSHSHPAFWPESPVEYFHSTEMSDTRLTASGGKSLLPALADWLAARGNTGLLVTVENWPDLDFSSQEFLRRLLSNRQELATYRVALVCGLPSSPARDTALGAEEPPGPGKETGLPALFRDGAFLWRRIEISALSSGGVQAWLRHSLLWEAPAAFVDWLHTRTGGLPVRIRESLDFLLKEKILFRSEATVGRLLRKDRRYSKGPRQNWQLRPDFAECGLTAYLERLAEGVPNNLPWPGSGSGLTEFIGREDNLHTIKQQLLSAAYGTGEGPLVTIIGPGGVGKTRLALQAGAEMLPHFRDGVYFVPLVGILNPSEIIPAIGEALRLRLTGDRRAMQTQLFKHLQKLRCLLILDNFEQLLEGAGTLAELLAQAPQVHLLVTSREPLKLKLQTEATLWLEGLSFPASVEADNFDYYGAVRLFVQKVRQPLAETSLPELDRFWLLKLCRLVEGIPLGLELAATWLGSFSLPQIVRELEQNSDFTALPGPQPLSGDTTARLPERHRRLEAVINWFWTRLSRAEQRLVEGLSVFRGGFRFEAAREVVGTSPFFLDSLIAKSFLSVSPQGRYEMHELLRQYAGAKLAKQSREEGWARLRYGRYFANFLQKRENDLENGRPEVLEEVGAELENIRNAWQWLVDNNRLELVSRCVRGLSFFYQYKGFHGEGEETLDAALVRLRRLHARFKATTPAETDNITDMHKFAKVYPPEPAPDLALLPLGPHKGLNRKMVEDALARVLIEIGAFLLEHSSFEQMCQYGAEALELARAHRQRGLEGAALARVGNGLLWQGKYPAARAHLEGGLRLAREAGIPLVQADCLRQLGILADLEEDYPTSIIYAQRGLLIYRQLGNRLWESASLGNIGEAYFQQSYYAEAQEFLLAALTLATQINFGLIQTLACINLGKISTMQGDYGAARHYLDQGLAIARRFNNTRMEAEGLCALALLAHFRGEDALAAELGEQALQITRNQGNREYEGYALTFLGHAYTGLGRWPEAETAYQAAYDLRTGLHQYAKSLDPLVGLALCARTAKNHALAQSYARRMLNFLAGKKWSLNGIMDALWVNATCREILEEGSTLEDDGETAWQLRQFGVMAEELRERRYGPVEAPV